MAKILRQSDANKVQKPRPDFPLFPHATGRWAKKVRGRLVYFGKVAGDEKGRAALDKWLEQKDDLLAGRTPRAGGEGLTIKELANRFMAQKKALMDNGELTPRTFAELYQTCARVGQAFGWKRLVADVDTDDFGQLRRAIARKWGPVRLGNEIQRIRSVFKFSYDAALIQQPVRYGPSFKKPSRKVLRVERAKRGVRMFEAAELRNILDRAGQPLRAMILLGLNCGFGNTDVATLPRSAVDLARGWIDFPRGKTGIPRRCPLWPETVQALREGMASRPRPTSMADDGLVFVTKYGRSWRRCEQEAIGGDEETGGKTRVRLRQDDAVAKEFSKVIHVLKLHRPGLGFYTLRHVFATVGSEAKDQIAVNALMGHVDETMAAVYRERIDDARLLAVTEHVRRWLFGEDETK